MRKSMKETEEKEVKMEAKEVKGKKEKTNKANKTEKSEKVKKAPRKSKKSKEVKKEVETVVEPVVAKIVAKIGETEYTLDNDHRMAKFDDMDHAILLPFIYGITKSLERPFSLANEDNTLGKMIKDYGGISLSIETEGYKAIFSHDGKRIEMQSWVVKDGKRKEAKEEQPLVMYQKDVFKLFDGKECILNLDTSLVGKSGRILKKAGKTQISEEDLDLIMRFKDAMRDGGFVYPVILFQAALSAQDYVNLRTYYERVIVPFTSAMYEVFSLIAVSLAGENGPEFLVDVDEQFMEEVIVPTVEKSGYFVYYA